ncbi:MAG: glycosyltransferase family 39 protein [Candidatus Eiseniibacteriota bacterium]
MAYAWDMWRGGLRPLDLNPHSGEWPGLSLYVTLALQVAYRLVFSIGTSEWDAHAFAASVAANPRDIYLFARGASVLLGVITVFLTYRVGKKAMGSAVGLLGAGLLATNSFHVLTSQHVSDPNLLALLFTLLASIGSVAIVQGGGVRSVVFTGAMIGFAGASKYVPLVLLGALAGALIVAPKANGPDRAARWKMLAIGVITCGVAFALASPYSLLDWRTTLHDALVQRERHRAEWVGQAPFSFALPTYLLLTLPTLLGWPAYVLGVAGSIYLLTRQGRARVLAAVPVLFLLAYGFLSVAQPRFILPAVPFLLLAGSTIPILVIAPWAGRRWSRWAGPAVVGVLTVLMAAVPFRDLLHARRDLGLPDTRRLALREARRLIVPGEMTGMDVYGPPLGTGPADPRATLWPFFAEQASLTEAAYHPEWLDGLDYYIVSEGVESRFRSRPAGYVRQVAFYDWIRANGAIAWTPPADKASGPNITILRLPRGISSQAGRDSLWGWEQIDPRADDQMALWCYSLSGAFLQSEKPERAEEWARRGLSISNSRSRLALYRLLSDSQLEGDREGNRVRDLMQTARAGLEEFPNDYVLHSRLAMCLDVLGDRSAAIQHYETSLRENPQQPGADGIRKHIALLKERVRD